MTWGEEAIKQDREYQRGVSVLGQCLARGRHAVNGWAHDYYDLYADIFMIDIYLLMLFFDKCVPAISVEWSARIFA